MKVGVEGMKGFRCGSTRVARVYVNAFVLITSLLEVGENVCRLSVKNRMPLNRKLFS